MQQESKLDKYKLLQKLGEGTFGTVYQAEDQKTKDIVALKKIRLESADEGIPSTAIREISLLKELQHPNIVKLLDVIREGQQLVLVFEYIEEDLKAFLTKQKNNKLDPQVVKSLIYQLFKGIEQCHRNKVLHRDLKPQNLLVSKEGILKIADFGLARGSGVPVKNYTNEVVTLWYRPPDVLLGSQSYTSSIDIWSIGCIFAEVVNMTPLFRGKDDDDQLIKIFELVGAPNSEKWSGVTSLEKWKEDKFKGYTGKAIKDLCPGLCEQGLDLLEQTLKNNPAERITAKKALDHPYFKDIPESLKHLYNKK